MVLLLTLKRQVYVQILFWLKNCANHHLDPKPKLFQSLNRNRHKSLGFHNSGRLPTLLVTF
jgi:hypothetical protein